MERERRMTGSLPDPEKRIRWATGVLHVSSTWFGIGAVAAALGVALGAFGAHGLKTRVSPEMLVVFETAVRYHMIHALGLLAVGWAADRWPVSWVQVSGVLMLVGIAIFSGSLYAMTLTGARWLGAITPLGGLALIAGWGWDELLQGLDTFSARLQRWGQRLASESKPDTQPGVPGSAAAPRPTTASNPAVEEPDELIIIDGSAGGRHKLRRRDKRLPAIELLDEGSTISDVDFDVSLHEDDVAKPISGRTQSRKKAAKSASIRNMLWTRWPVR